MFKVDRWFLGIMAFGALFHVLIATHILHQFPKIAMANDFSYSYIGKHIQADHVYSIGVRNNRQELQPTSWRPPVYPLLHAFFYSFVKYDETLWEVLRWMGILLILLSAGIAYRIGGYYSSNVGRWAALLTVLDINTLYAAHDVHDADILLLFLFSCFLLFFMKILHEEASVKNIAWCSIFLGVSALTKPIVMYLWIPVTAFLIYRAYDQQHHAWRALCTKVSVFLLIQGVLVGGWKVRNLVSTGYPQFSTMVGAHQLLYNAALMEAYQKNTDYVSARRAIQAKYIVPSSTAWDEGMQNLYLFNMGTTLIKHSKMDFAITLVRRIPAFLFGTPPVDFLATEKHAGDLHKLKRSHSGMNYTRFSGFFKVMWENQFYGLVLAGFGMKLQLLLVYIALLWGTVVILREKRDLGVFACWVIISYFILTACPLATGRYRIPMMPVVALLASLGLSHGWKFLSGYVKKD